MPSFQLTTNKTVPYTPTDVDCIHIATISFWLSIYCTSSILLRHTIIVNSKVLSYLFWNNFSLNVTEKSPVQSDNYWQYLLDRLTFFTGTGQALMSSPVLPSTPVNRCIICWSLMPSSYYNFNYTAQNKIYSEDIFFQNKTIWFPFSENLVISNFDHINVSVMFVICFQHLALFSPSL